MVVGFESVGKTTILDCLFPLEGYLTQQRKLGRTKYWFKLQGNTLRKYEKRGDTVPQRDKVIVFENRQWEIAALPKDFGIKVTPKVAGQKDIEVYCGDEVTQEVWLGRLRRVCMNEATHGIEIQSHSIDNDITREYFRKVGREIGEIGRIDVSVWDFAGQQDYYNNHHYFISTRTVFLVLWKMSEGDDKGMRGLEFWFRSLATHLGVSPAVSSSSSPTAATPLSGTYYSIIVVGTFLDHSSVKNAEKPVRQQKIEEIAKECGLGSSSSPSSLQYYEVSCSSSLENIGEVQDGIVRTMLSHSYMGERVPKSYLTISEHLRQKNEERKRREGRAQKRRLPLPKQCHAHSRRKGRRGQKEDSSRESNRVGTEIWRGGSC